MGRFYARMEKLYNMREFSWAADHASRSGTLASRLDQLIKISESFEAVVKQAAEEGRKRGHRTNYTEGAIHNHIKFRIRQAVRNKSGKLRRK